MAEKAYIEKFAKDHPDWDSAKGIAEYQVYVDKLENKLPGSYTRLKRFLEKGNCTCQDGKFNACKCENCTGDGKCEENGKCPQCKGGCNECNASPFDDVVRIYEIYPEEKDWGKFLDVHTFRVARNDGFVELQKKLANPAFDGETEQGEDGINSQSTIKVTGQTRHKSRRSATISHATTHVVKQMERLEKDVVSSSVAEETDEFLVAEEGRKEEDDPEEALPDKLCRIITVSHLSPNVARLLGSKFNISADFFNRHLPGTEAISGRLISRLPSAVQIDMDELYESYQAFDELWPNYKVVEAGHSIIKHAIKQHFLFPVGWDYFPVKAKDWQDSMRNISLFSGYEVMLKEQGEQDVKNLFQFNLAHRISVYSNPPKHPRTGISSIYLFPKLRRCIH